MATERRGGRVQTLWINWPLSLKTNTAISSPEFVRYDLSYLSSFGIVCQFLARLRRCKIVGQAKEI